MRLSCNSSVPYVNCSLKLQQSAAVVILAAVQFYKFCDQIYVIIVHSRFIYWLIKPCIKHSDQKVIEQHRIKTSDFSLIQVMFCLVQCKEKQKNNFRFQLQLDNKVRQLHIGVETMNFYGKFSFCVASGWFLLVINETVNALIVDNKTLKNFVR